MVCCVPSPQTLQDCSLLSSEVSASLDLRANLFILLSVTSHSSRLRTCPCSVDWPVDIFPALAKFSTQHSSTVSELQELVIQHFIIFPSSMILGIIEALTVLQNHIYFRTHSSYTSLAFPSPLSSLSVSLSLCLFVSLLSKQLLEA